MQTDGKIIQFNPFCPCQYENLFTHIAPIAKWYEI